MQTLQLLIAMALFQFLWLGAIWCTGASGNQKKLVTLLIYSVVVTLGMMSWRLFLPLPLVSKLKEQLLEIEAGHLVTLCFVTVTIGTAYAYYQRLWPFDEENNFEASKVFADKGIVTFFNNYAQIPWLGSQHPPLIPLLGGLVMRIFGKHLFAIRLISLAMCTATILITYFLGRAIYDKETGLLAALLLLSFPLILRQGSAAMLDMPITFFYALTLLMIYHLPYTSSPHQLALAIGLTIGVGFLTKYTIGLIYAIFIPLFLASEIYGAYISLLPVIVLIPMSVLAVWLLYSAKIGVFAIQLNQLAIFSGSKSANPNLKLSAEHHSLKFKLTKGWRMRLRLETLTSRLPSALGPYNIPLLFLVGLYTVGPRGQLDPLLGLWIVVLFVLLILALPDHRYFMPIFPALSIMMAHGVRSISNNSEQVAILALLFCGGAWYLFVDWSRKSQLFIRS